MNRFATALLVSGLLLGTSPADAADDPQITILRPGGGFIAVDGVSVIPLEILVRNSKGLIKLKRARVRATLGRVRREKIVGPGRITLFYKPPRRPVRAAEQFDLRLTDTKGRPYDLSADAFEIPAARPPGLVTQTDPSAFDVTAPRNVQITASTSGDGVSGLELHATNGQLSVAKLARSASTLNRSATWSPPLNVPQDGPSHFIILGVSSGQHGFNASARGVSGLARISVRAEIARGSSLLIEGAETNPDPVPAPADGLTTVHAVVRYGANVQAFEVRRRRKKPLPIEVPYGMVESGIAVEIPGQNVADGGTGPSIVVAVPPSPFGDGVIWPEIELEGAKIKKLIDVSNGVRAVVMRRPKEAKSITVLADGEAIGTIEFGPGHGSTIELNADFPRGSERGAVLATVRDRQGALTNHPEPRARLASGEILPVESDSPGKYRISLPSTTLGSADQAVNIIAELEPPPTVSGDSPELAYAERQVNLEGPPPAIKAVDEPVVEAPADPADDSGLGIKVGLAALASGGATFAAAPVFGGGVSIELRLPIADHRFGFRTGLEYIRSGGSGELAFPGAPLPTTTTLAGMLIPFDFGFAVVQTESFDLLVRAGLALRFDNGVLDIEPDGGAKERIGGGRRFGVGGRAMVEGDIKIGEKGAFTAAVGVGGIGAAAGGFSSPAARIDGSLTQLRLDLGYRFWL